ncbi:MAG TPA: protein-L-isoaspartate(D-aspartate) O-methyltransferase [Pyrinomonadaceae bacterium]|nr:protein-L-isoaspartate(D-aspartate) O-methyltransferase [Pyrinomonadaceae bacterium]
MSSTPSRQRTLAAEFRIPRERMIERLRGHYGIRDQKVLEAMRIVPRHFFVTEALRGRAYDDNALPINFNQTISQPFIVARMSELLEVDKKSRVLEIGAGSGYQTAILSQLASQVYAIERIGELAREAQGRIRELGIYNATVKAFDGTLGWNAHGPYDAILVAAGGPKIPDPLIAQLGVGGRLVIPIGETRESQKLVRVIKSETSHKVEEYGPCQFVPLIGQHGWEKN